MNEINEPTPDSEQELPPISPQAEKPKIDTSRPAVAMAPGKTVAIIVGILLFVGFIIYTIFSGDDESEEKVVIKREGKIAEADSRIAPPPPAPAPPPPAPVTPPPPPPPPIPQVTAKEAAEFEFQEIDPETRSARLRSNMLIVNGSGASFGSTTTQPAKRKSDNPDPNAQFAEELMSASEFEKSEASKIGDTRSIIAQGKVIDAVLETAINTDLPGTLRAIVSNDIYAEAGNAVLIPRGSRLVGAYNSEVRRGQKRILIVWQRVIRPDGIDLRLNSYGVDNLGRSGMEGMVDNKYREMFGAAALTSIITLSVAAILEATMGEENTTTSRRTFTDGSIETSGTSTAQATTSMIGSLGQTSSSVVREFIDMRPTIAVNQGEPMKVFVNRDLIFPEFARGQVNMIK